jgi:hypothetical protein
VIKLSGKIAKNGEMKEEWMPFGADRISFSRVSKGIEGAWYYIVKNNPVWTSA